MSSDTIRSRFSSYKTQSHTCWGQRSENHQINVQQLWSTVTYMLRAGRGQKTIRSLFSNYTTQSHTNWGQEEVRNPSEHYSAAMKHSHIQTEGRKRSENQITVQQLWNTVTYMLKAWKGQKSIRSLFSSYETQLHTHWGQEEVRKLYQCSAAISHSHIHPESRERSENHQITVQQLWNTVTYTLRAGRGQKTIRSLFSSYETQSHTRWGQEEVRKPWDHCSAAMKHSHIHPEGRKRSENHQINVQQLWNSHIHPEGRKRSENYQITVQQLWNTVTYRLRAGRGQKTIRSLCSSYEIQSHTFWGQEEVRKPSDHCAAAMKHSHIQAEGRKRSENHQINVQQLWNTVTYILRAGRGQKTIRSLFSSYETQSLTC